MSTSVACMQDGAVGPDRGRRLRIQPCDFEQVLRCARLLLRPSLTAVVAIEYGAFFADYPGGTAVGCKPNRVEIAVLKQCRPRTFFEGLLNPALAVIGRGQQ